MTASRRIKYRILLAQHIQCDFHVSAKSFEDACKILQRELRTDNFRHARFSAVIDAHWSEPSKHGEAWLVMRDNEGWHDLSPIMIWDGKEVSDSGLPVPPMPVAPEAGKKKDAYTKRH